MSAPVNKTAGEVTVNSLEVMSEFEKTSIQILRHANDLFQENEPADLPMSIKELFSNQFSRYLISDLISLFATYYLRPIVSRHPDCTCVGADENVFANILSFYLENQENEVKLLGSLLIKVNHVEALTQKARVVAFLINEDLKKSLEKHKFIQTTYNNHLH